MGQVYQFLGLSVGLVQAGMSPEERRKAYACDVKYVTNQELGFDFLRDNLAMSRDEVVGAALNFCVVDEGDSVLIDEARVPLVISSSVADSTTEAQRCALPPPPATAPQHRRTTSHRTCAPAPHRTLRRAAPRPRRTPRPTRSRYSMAAKLGDALVPGVHYEVFEKQKTITLNEEGQTYAAIS